MENTNLNNMFKLINNALEDYKQTCIKLGFEDRTADFQSIINTLPKFQEMAKLRIHPLDSVKLDSILDSDNWLVKGGDHIMIKLNGKQVFHGPIEGIEGVLLVG